MRVFGVIAIVTKFLVVFIRVSVPVKVVIEADIGDLPPVPLAIYLQSRFDFVVFLKVGMIVPALPSTIVSPIASKHFIYPFPIYLGFLLILFPPIP